MRRTRRSFVEEYFSTREFWIEHWLKAGSERRHLLVGYLAKQCTDWAKDAHNHKIFKKPTFDKDGIEIARTFSQQTMWHWEREIEGYLREVEDHRRPFAKSKRVG